MAKSHTPHMSDQDLYTIRRENLGRWVSEKGAKTALAIALGVNPSRVSHMLKAEGPGSRPIMEDTAHEIERALGKSPGAMDRRPALRRQASERSTPSC